MTDKNMEKLDRLLPSCSSCFSEVSEPYIECAECDTINLCLHCFANGKEVKLHKNDHSYSVRRNDFPLFHNCNWTAKEEYCLVEAVSTHGYGNWEDVAKKIKTRSELECQEHYRKYYIDNVQCSDLPTFEERTASLFPPTVIPHLFTQTHYEEPIRELGNQHTAGYNAFRSDFELNYDNNAENIFSIDAIDSSEDKELMDGLKCSLILAYNNRLQERQRRYDIMKRHGLIVPRKLTSWLQKFDSTLGRTLAERLCTFMQFMDGLQFEAFMESVNYEYDLNSYLQQLLILRQNGVTTFKGAALYNKLKQQRENYSKELKSMSNDQTDWRNITTPDNQTPEKSKLVMQGMLLRDLNNKNHMKRVIPPLDILNLPNYEKLTEKERDLCTSIRLVPQNFLDIKSVLITENDKLGYLRLLDARRLIKIDVNKTRRIYDYLVREGFVKKP